MEFLAVWQRLPPARAPPPVAAPRGVTLQSPLMADDVNGAVCGGPVGCGGLEGVEVGGGGERSVRRGVKLNTAPPPLSLPQLWAACGEALVSAGQVGRHFDTLNDTSGQ